jgi:hypothetical protein
LHISRKCVTSLRSRKSCLGALGDGNTCYREILLKTYERL